MTDEELLDALRAVAATPGAAIDEPPSVLDVQLGGDLGSLLQGAQLMSEHLRRLREGGVEALEPGALEQADALLHAANTPASTAVPPPATPAAVAAAEAALGFALPDLLRAIYLEVANGGIGPGAGLLGVGGGWAPDGRTLAEEHAMAVEGPVEGWRWPAGLLPVADLGDGVTACLATDRPGAPVLAWDASELDWDSGEPLEPEVTEVAPSLSAWLDRWQRTQAPPGT